MPHDLTEGNITKTLLKFSLPIMIGMSLHTAYNIIDTIFVGMLGPLQIAAVSLAFPVVFVFIAFASGIGIGANALISRAVGRKDFTEADNLAEHAFFLAIIMSLIIAVAGIVFSPYLFTAMGADEELLGLTMEYATPIFIGVIFMFIWFISDSVLKSQGDSKTPVKILAVSVLLNIILDPIFIFGFGFVPAMGLAGAAWATVIARIVGATTVIFFIFSPKCKINLNPKHFKPEPKQVINMLKVGLPASASEILGSAGFMALTGIVGGFGSFAIAGLGIGLRLNSVVIMPLIGLGSGVITVVGQNLGARKPERAKQTAIVATKIGVFIGLFFMLISLLFSKEIVGIFSNDAEVLRIGVEYLSIVALGFGFMGINHIFVHAFQGAGRTDLAFIVSTIYWVTTVVAGLILSQTMGLTGVWIGMTGAVIIESIIVSAIFLSGKWLDKEKKII